MNGLEILRFSIALSVILIGLIFLFKVLGKGRTFGIIVLSISSIYFAFTSLVQFGFNQLPTGSSCSAITFYSLTGGLGCNPIPLAACYSAIIYGVINIVFFPDEQSS